MGGVSVLCHCGALITHCNLTLTATLIAILTLTATPTPTPSVDLGASVILGLTPDPSAAKRPDPCALLAQQLRLTTCHLSDDVAVIDPSTGAPLSATDDDRITALFDVATTDAATRVHALGAEGVKGESLGKAVDFSIGKSYRLPWPPVNGGGGGGGAGGGVGAGVGGGVNGSGGGNANASASVEEPDSGAGDADVPPPPPPPPLEGEGQGGESASGVGAGAGAGGGSAGAIGGGSGVSEAEGRERRDRLLLDWHLAHLEHVYGAPLVRDRRWGGAIRMVVNGSIGEQRSLSCSWLSCMCAHVASISTATPTAAPTATPTHISPPPVPHIPGSP